jgi:hypothetical protein
MTLIEVVKKNMSIMEVTETMILDRVESRKRIHMADSD